jgi:hypothetical protein
MNRGLKVVFCLMFLILVSSFLSAQNRYALVIGNASYQRIKPLNNTKNDAADIAASLRSLGFQVDIKYDLTHLQTVSAINAFTTRLAGNVNSEGFFWYAGHAVQIRDENFLLPIDVSIDSESHVSASSFRLNNLVEALGDARNKVNVVILDSCRDNPLPASGRSAGSVRGMTVVNVPPTSDIFVMYSTAPGEKAADGATGKRNSPFAEAFLKYMKNPEPLSLMTTDIVNETLTITGGVQRPWTNGSIASDKYYSLNLAGGTPEPSPRPNPIPQPRPQPNTGIAIEVTTTDAGTLYFEGNEVAILWDNDSYSVPIERPGTYKIRMLFDGGYELEKSISISTRGITKVDFSSTNYAIGDYGPSGGIIVGTRPFIKGWQYLEVALANSEFLVNLSAVKEHNTLLINKGYIGWRLPTSDELNLIYENLYKRGIGNLRNQRYWSSSQRWNNGNAYDDLRYKDFRSGETGQTSDNQYSCYVRTVRLF